MYRLKIFESTREKLKDSARIIKSHKSNKNLEYLFSKLNCIIINKGNSSILKVEYDINNEYKHGNVRLGDIFSLNKDFIKIINSKDFKGKTNDLSGKDIICFDIETTGLSGGAGTVFFLIGFLKVEAGHIKIIQFFLNNLSSEGLFLRYIKDFFNQNTIFFSYNGKSFDYSIIKNRLIINRYTPLEDELTHIDLLFTSRRFWRGILPDFTLKTVENMILNLNRFDDIPGYLVPSVYFN